LLSPERALSSFFGLRLSLNRNPMTALRLLSLLLALGPTSARAAGDPVRIERRLGAMGTWLTLEVEAHDRAAALSASEAAVRAVAACEARLSTWRDDSELARLNAAAVGEPFPLSAALERELRAAREVFDLTGGAFDPTVGALVRVWDLRGRGRLPTREEIEGALVPAGLAALRLEPGRAVRTLPALALEEGGFGKGAGLDDARAALLAAGALSACVDLGGQVLCLGEPLAWDVAHPQERERAVLRVELPEGSLATSGNSERGLLVDGVRVGHILDPRSGRPAADFGSVSVWCVDAARADALATGLFVLGPDAALELAARSDDFAALVLEPQADGGLRARATGRFLEGLRVLDASVRLEPVPPSAARAGRGAGG
jgi:thiamine biosynthesis lipoprotein